MSMSLGLMTGLVAQQQAGGAPVLTGPATYSVQTLVDGADIPATVSYTPTSGTVNTVFFVTTKEPRNPALTVGGVTAKKVGQFGSDYLAIASTPDSEGVQSCAAFLAQVSGAGAQSVAIMTPNGVSGEVVKGHVLAFEVQNYTIRSVFHENNFERLPTTDIAMGPVSNEDVSWRSGEILVDVLLGNNFSGAPAGTKVADESYDFGSFSLEVIASIPETGSSGTRTSENDFSKTCGIGSFVFKVTEDVSFVHQPKIFGHVYGLANGDSSRSVTFGGVCFGSPDTVQARVMNASDNTEAVTWTSGTVSDGAWSVSITVPRGDDYYLQMREASGETVFEDRSRFSVGYQVGIYGQSNALFMENTRLKTAVENAEHMPFGLRQNGRIFNRDTVGNRALHVAAPCAIATYNGAVGGVGIDRLSKGGGFDYYEDFLAQLQQTGEPISHILWQQGENDTTLGNPDYPATLEQIRVDLETDLGQTAGSLKMHVGGLAWTSGSGYDFWAAINDEIIEASVTYPHIYYSHSMIDAELSDGIHYIGESYQKMGQRFAHSIKFVEGDAASAAVFIISGLTRTSDTLFDVNLAHGIGTDFTTLDGGAIEGFVVSTNSDFSSPITPTSVARLDADTIRITLPSAETGTVYVSYMSGKNPLSGVSGGAQGSVVIDNGSLAMPLRPLTSISA